jgi:hypothetical protein
LQGAPQARSLGEGARPPPPPPQVEAKDLLLVEWSNTSYQPCHFVALDQQRAMVVLGIRGSLQLGARCGGVWGGGARLGASSLGAG